MFVTVEKYKNRKSKPPFEFVTLAEFEVDDKELDKFPSDSSIVEVVYPRVCKLGYVPQFWSLGTTPNSIKVVHNDREECR